MLHRSWFDNIFYQAREQPRSFRLVALPLSKLFYALQCLRNLAFDYGIFPRKRLPGICISVGNISLGGTGKSPVVIALAQHLWQSGVAPAILTRGYGSSLGKRDWAVICDGKVLATTGAPLLHADEAMMQSRALPGVPIILGRNRYRAACWFLRQFPQHGGPSHWLLDDGFQHRSLHRDLDLVLLDQTQPWGNHQLLPLGSLREPPSSLSRASALLVTRSASSEPAPALQHLLRGYSAAPVFAVPFRTPSLDLVAGRFDRALHKARILAVSGIARPTQFIRSLHQHQLIPVAQLIVGDHEEISSAQLRQRAASLDVVITTAKDYYRMPETFITCGKPVYILALLADLPYTKLLTTFPRYLA